MISLTVFLLPLNCVRLFYFWFGFMIRKNTTLPNNIENDCKRSYLDFTLNTPASLLCYAPFTLYSVFFSDYTYDIHYLHRMLMKKTREREEKQKTSKLLTNKNQVNRRIHVYTPCHLTHVRSLFIICHFSCIFILSYWSRHTLLFDFYVSKIFFSTRHVLLSLWLVLLLILILICSRHINMQSMINN